jgi:glutathione S-transferase
VVHEQGKSGKYAPSSGNALRAVDLAPHNPRVAYVSAQVLRLYDYPASANCLKVRMLLSQLGLPYERVPVDIFAGESQTAEYLARNPAGRTPLLETSDGAFIAESGAILLYLAEATAFLPDERVARAHVHAWMFFEQNLLEPNVGTARFWRLTGRAAERPEVFARHFDAGAAALETLERGLGGDYLVAGRYSVADCALYAYVHVAHDAGYDMSAYPRIAAWLARVAATPGAIDDLEPYPASAHQGAGGRSAHDRPT